MRCARRCLHAHVIELRAPFEGRAAARSMALADARAPEHLLPFHLGSIDIDYLRGGPRHAVDVVLVDLIAQNRLTFSAATNHITRDSSDLPHEEAS